MKRPFKPSLLLERQYELAIQALLAEQLSLATVHEGDPSLLHYLSELAVNAPRFDQAAEFLASRMIRGVQVANAQSWRAAARESLQGRRIYNLLQRELAHGGGDRISELARENARLIRRVPIDLSRRATALASSAQQQGLRPEAIIAQLRKVLPSMAEARIRLIARTEVSKAASAVTRARAERLDITHYVWRTSEDGRVRKSHRLMDGVLVAWDNPPSPEKLAKEKSYSEYNAGNTFACRCVALPLIDLDQVSWPARVFDGNEIVRMSRSRFAALHRVPIAA